MFCKKIKTIIIVEGMSCEHCVNKVKNAIYKINDVKKVKINLSKKMITVFSGKKIDKNKLKEQIQNLDYKVVNIMGEDA